MIFFRLSKRALSIIILATLGFAIAFSLPVASKSIITTLNQDSALSQTSNFTNKIISQQLELANPTNPTPEMIAFFERRTRQHIYRVSRCLTVLAKLPSYPQEIINRGKIHDKSKFVSPERLPYIWLTEFHRRRQKGKNFTYPNGVKEQVEDAIQHHLTTNRHHPEFHPSSDDMFNIDLIEMACDWTAIAQELGENGGSARQWADKTIGKREHFNFGEAKKQFIYQVIDDIDRQFAVTSNSPRDRTIIAQVRD